MTVVAVINVAILQSALTRPFIKIRKSNTCVRVYLAK